MTIETGILVFVRFLLYSIVIYNLLVLIFSANNRKNAKSYSVNIIYVLIFGVFDLMTVVRLLKDSTEIIQALGNYAMTPLLLVLAIKLGLQAHREEQEYISDTRKENRNVLTNHNPR